MRRSVRISVRCEPSSTTHSSRRWTPVRPTHPLGAAAVKELYGSSEEVRGWSVSLKVDSDSNGGLGWYWYERFGTSVFADAVGTSLCTGCHGRDAAGITSKDYILIPFPLQ